MLCHPLAHLCVPASTLLHLRLWLADRLLLLPYSHALTLTPRCLVKRTHSTYTSMHIIPKNAGAQKA